MKALISSRLCTHDAGPSTGLTAFLNLRPLKSMNRRRFLQSTAALAATPLFGNESIVSMPKGKAEHCIFLWLGGGMSQIDTFDPKAKGNSKSDPKKAGSEYDAIDTAVPGVRVCEHLQK